MTTRRLVPAARMALALALAPGISGCHSAFVQTTITNTGPVIRVVEMDYPSQSFGTSQLAPRQTFHYRFKVQGEGPIKLEFNDAAGKPHTSTGPTLREGDQGTLHATIASDGQVQWETKIQPGK